VDEFVDISTPEEASAMMIRRLLKKLFLTGLADIKFFCLYQLAFLYRQNRESGGPCY
jgi:hypothetical protein